MSTQIELFKNLLKAQNLQVVQLREPGSTEFGEKLREVILGQEQPVSPLSEVLLFSAARAELIHQKIAKLLAEENTVVLIDRYIDSTYAYQGSARGLGFDIINQIHQISPLDLRPDITFYLKIDLLTSLSRQAQRGNEKDYFEQENNSFYQKLIDGYNQAATLYPERIKTIDATKPVTEVTHAISTLWNNYVAS